MSEPGMSAAELGEPEDNAAIQALIQRRDRQAAWQGILETNMLDAQQDIAKWTIDYNRTGEDVRQIEDAIVRLGGVVPPYAGHEIKEVGA